MCRGEVVNVNDALWIVQWPLGGRMQMVMLQNGLLEEDKACNWFKNKDKVFIL